MTRTRTTVRLAGLAGALLAGALVLTGCSGDSTHEGMSGMSDSSSASTSAGSSAGSPGDASTGAEADHNDQDVGFAQEMLVHHEQAIEMAQAAVERAADPRVLDLAARIEAAQAPEVDTLTGWLQEWGVEDSSMGGMDHDGGMMSEEDMNALLAATGPEFDRQFLAGMLEHHRGAVQQAEHQIADGQNPDAIALATTVRDSQTAEIAEMEQLLTELGR